MPQVVPQKKVEENALTCFIGSYASSIEGLQELFSVFFIFSSLLFNSGPVMVEWSSVLIKTTSVCDGAFTQKILDDHWTLIETIFPPPNLSQQYFHKTFQLQNFVDSTNQIFSKFKFFWKLAAEIGGRFQGRGDFPPQRLEKGTNMMRTNNITIFPDVFGNSCDGSSFFIGEGFVEENKSVSNLWIEEVVPWRRVWTGFYSFGWGCSAAGASLESFSTSI